MANEKSREVIQEMVKFGVSVIRLCQDLPIPKSVIDQTIKSATSIGANFSEAQDASSKRDFVNKIYISKKEAAETKYWLNIIENLRPQTSNIQPLILQAHQLTMLLQKIINTSKTTNR